MEHRLSNCRRLGLRSLYFYRSTVTVVSSVVDDEGDEIQSFVGFTNKDKFCRVLLGSTALFLRLRRLYRVLLGFID